VELSFSVPFVRLARFPTSVFFFSERTRNFLYVGSQSGDNTDQKLSYRPSFETLSLQKDDLASDTVLTMFHHILRSAEIASQQFL